MFKSKRDIRPDWLPVWLESAILVRGGDLQNNLRSFAYRLELKDALTFCLTL